MTYPEFCELMIAFGSISMVRQGDNQRFEIDSKNKKIIMQLYKYITYNPDFEGNLDKGILLTGPFGTGKSVLMSAFASILTDYADSEIGQRRGVKVCKYIKSTEIFNEIIRNGRELPTKLVNTALVIDELGREAIKANDFGNDRHPIIDLIQARYNKGIVTHGTSNFSCHDLTSIEKYGPMIGDRIKSMFNFLELLGDSRRK
jgi:DNA replication protein DnaC